MEEILPKTIAKHMKDKVTGSSQHTFMKIKLCLANFIAFCDEMITDSADECKAVEMFILIRLLAASVNIIEKLMKYRIIE